MVVFRVVCGDLETSARKRPKQLMMKFMMKRESSDLTLAGGTDSLVV
jgi:hypothetical protein